MRLADLAQTFVNPEIWGISLRIPWDVEYLSTFNDAENVPILAINRRLGYQPQSGIYDLRCQIKE